MNYDLRRRLLELKKECKAEGLPVSGLNEILFELAKKRGPQTKPERGYSWPWFILEKLSFGTLKIIE